MGQYNIPTQIDYETNKNESILYTEATQVDDQLFFGNHASIMLGRYFDYCQHMLQPVLAVFAISIGTAYEPSIYGSDQFKDMVQFYGIDTNNSYVVPFSSSKFKQILKGSKDGERAVTPNVSMCINVLKGFIDNFDSFITNLNGLGYLISRSEYFQETSYFIKLIRRFFSSDIVADALDLIFLYSTYETGFFTPIYNNDGQQVSILINNKLMLPSLKPKPASPSASFQTSFNPILSTPRHAFSSFYKEILLIEQGLVAKDAQMRIRTMSRLYHQMDLLIEDSKNKTTIVEFTNPYSWA